MLPLRKCDYSNFRQLFKKTEQIHYVMSKNDWHTFKPGKSSFIDFVHLKMPINGKNRENLKYIYICYFI